MAIGARAVVAAGWPIAGASALAFAEAFYERILGGATFGDAVAAARIAAVEGSSDETWAAYQCYGDPGFELAVPRSKQRTAASEPISRDDLLRRVALLGIRASDLRRVDGAGLERSRTSLVESLDELAIWADERLAGDIEIQRQLAQVAKDLGEFDRAADRYESLIERKGRSYRLQPSGSVRDLREFANCLARDAQRSARKAATPQERAAAVGKMKPALAAAKRAAALREDKESWGILGSTLKKLATVDADRRDAHLRAALDAYGKANAFDDGGRYGAENAAQLAAVLGVDNPAVDADAPPTVKGRAATRRVIDQRDPSETDFWAKADGGDRGLTRLLRAEGPDEAATHQPHMVDAYKAAFATRSTWSQRNSSLDHLRDLFEVLNEDDWRRGLVQEALAELRQWEADNVAAEEDDDNANSTRTAPSSTKRRRTSQVTVVALPAGRGDSLWIEYQDGADQRRMLIDGGLGSAYGQASAPTSPEWAVANPSPSTPWSSPTSISITSRG